MVPPPIAVTDASTNTPSRSSRLRPAASAPLTANTPMPDEVQNATSVIAGRMRPARQAMIARGSRSQAPASVGSAPTSHTIDRGDRGLAAADLPVTARPMATSTVTQIVNTSMRPMSPSRIGDVVSGSRKRPSPSVRLYRLLRSTCR